ncbi:MAG: hypothetical protein C0481_02820 [Phenylobacterium sp.]|uniref:hypothetical protein n=1 Tax=Phenylobacterium sp. TaxID=1871053 RepID=UPI0025DEA051|nr:hypothetical protein [Phenylobacterium sp.]MBA4010777.1 hypothetical protein [Phenylobacterium sp.]
MARSSTHPLSAALAGLLRACATVVISAPLRLWALILAGPPLTAIDVWLVFVLKDGTWPEALRGQQLETIGALALVHAGLVAVVVVSLAAVKLEAQTRLGSISIGGDGDDPDPPSKSPA